jgi:hypothetical protein
MKDAMLILGGGLIGFDVAMVYAWRLIRRARHTSDVSARIRPYVGLRSWPW